MNETENEMVFKQQLLEELINLFKDGLNGNFQKSIYRDEISFEEYAIWWYHFYYSKVTDILIDEGHITRPQNGVFTIVGL